VDRIMNRIVKLTVAAAAVAAAIAACSSGNASSPAAPPGAATTTSATSAPAGSEAGGAITIEDFKFGDPITVAPGAVVTVTNKDSAAHDVVSDDEGKFKTPLLNQNETATFTAPTAPGTYKFSCSVHVNMHGIGTLIVQG
jgi:plastocyanin